MGKHGRVTWETQTHFYPMNSGIALALPGPPSDRGWGEGDEDFPLEEDP